jgi:hypothetical protein
MQLASNRQRQPPMETAIFRLKELTKRVNSGQLTEAQSRRDCPNELSSFRIAQKTNTLLDCLH